MREAEKQLSDENVYEAINSSSLKNVRNLEQWLVGRGYQRDKVKKEVN